MIIPIHPFLLDVLLHVLHQPARTCRDPGGKPSGARVYYPSLRFPQYFSVSLLTQCTQTPTERCSSPVEAVLTGSRAALPGLIEMFEVPAGDTALLTKANTIITVEGSRLQPRDALDASQLTRVRHQSPACLW